MANGEDKLAGDVNRVRTNVHFVAEGFEDLHRRRWERSSDVLPEEKGFSCFANECEV